MESRLVKIIDENRVVELSSNLTKTIHNEKWINPNNIEKIYPVYSIHAHHEPDPDGSCEKFVKDDVVFIGTYILLNSVGCIMKNSWNNTHEHIDTPILAPYSVDDTISILSGCKKIEECELIKCPYPMSEMGPLIEF